MYSWTPNFWSVSPTNFDILPMGLRITSRNCGVAFFEVANTILLILLLSFSSLSPFIRRWSVCHGWLTKKRETRLLSQEEGKGPTRPLQESVATATLHSAVNFVDSQKLRQIVVLNFTKQDCKAVTVLSTHLLSTKIRESNKCALCTDCPCEQLSHFPRFILGKILFVLFFSKKTWPRMLL